MLSWSQELERSAFALAAGRLGQLRAQRVARVDSTNTALLQAAQRGDICPQVLWADVQTAGRGRLGRQWHSTGAIADDGAGAPERRSLTFSLGLALAPQAWSGLSLVVGLAVAEVLGADIALKWPNDVCVRSTSGYAKLGGILLETQALSETVAPSLAAQTGLHHDAPARWLVIGVGLNVQGHPSADLRAPATDICSALPTEQAQTLLADLPALCTRLILAILQAVLRFETTGFAPFAPAFSQRDVLLGQSVATFQEGQQVETGAALGVAADGSYQLRLADGRLHAIHSAEISLRPSTLGTESLTL